MRKLVIAGIINSAAGKDGGFQLARSVEKISVYDVFAALEGEECELKMSGLGHRIFIDNEKFVQGEEKVVSVFERANAAFGDELKKLLLSELVSREHYLEGDVDFTARASALRQKTS